MLYFLAKNPEKQEKLRKEVLSVVGPKGNNVTLESLNELNYLKACIKESLRLRPAVMGNGRILGDDIVLSGYNVKKGVNDDLQLIYKKIYIFSVTNFLTYFVN